MTHHVRAIWQFRYFWLSLVRLDLRNRYRRSVLGIGWSLLNPLAMTAVFCVVFSGIMMNNDWRTYAPFLIAGLSVWEFIKGTAIQGCDSFIRAESYIRQCPLPYGIYPLRTTLGTLIHFAISMVVVVAASALVMESWTPVTTFWAVVPGLLLVTVFAFSLATLAAFAHVYFHDTKHLFEVGSQLYFFMTPIMYARPVLDRQGLGWVADLNPVTVFLDIIRDPLLTGVPPTPDQLTVAGVLTLASFGLACGTMVWLQKKVIFQL
jgi:ABC-type polysaccharide/polyol phosphate export permease